jgi:hypothetical protein
VYVVPMGTGFSGDLTTRRDCADVPLQLTHKLRAADNIPVAASSNR